MWHFNGDKMWNDDNFIDGDNRLRIEYVHPRHCKERYELYELWFAREDPKDWDNPIYYRNYINRRELIMSFDTRGEAWNFLETLTWVLNAPEDIPLDIILSQRMIDTAANANTYELLARQEQEKREAEERRKAFDKGGSRVYILAWSNGTVKIGKADDVEKRIAQLMTGNDYDLLKWCCTGGLDMSEAYAIEHDCHFHFSKQRTRREFFKVP